jgi:hypothetical protein
MLKRLLLIMLLIGVVGVAVGPSAFAAATTSSAEDEMVFDPFALSAISVTAMDDDASEPVDLTLIRPAIRVPFRPELRSAFRPSW